jgi:hypothetical protein
MKIMFQPDPSQGQNTVGKLLLVHNKHYRHEKYTCSL